MKRSLSCTLALLLLLPALLLPADANSEPVTYRGVDSSSLTTDTGCPITVASESLTFTVGKMEGRNLPVAVTAVYQMENPTEEPLSVTMAFYLDAPDGPPYGGESQYAARYTDSITITAGGRAVPFDVQHAGPEEGGGTRIALIHTVDFPARGGQEVAVSYQTLATGSREGSIRKGGALQWKEIITYLLSPAQNWAAFGSLDITVNTTEEYPYILESSHPLEADGAYRYTGHFDALPEGDLDFTLYVTPRITLWDRLATTLTDPYLLFFLRPAGVILLVTTVVLVIRWRLGKRKTK